MSQRARVGKTPGKSHLAGGKSGSGSRLNQPGSAWAALRCAPVAQAAGYRDPNCRSSGCPDPYMRTHVSKCISAAVMWELPRLVASRLLRYTACFAAVRIDRKRFAQIVGRRTTIHHPGVGGAHRSPNANVLPETHLAGPPTFRQAPLPATATQARSPPQI